MHKNFNIQKVLVAPLDWGLGHATRDIAIIRALISNGYEVILAADGMQRILLQTEFPSLTVLPLEGYAIRYGKTKTGFIFTLLKQIPRVYGIIRREHYWLEKVISEYGIDLVISDNRFGLYTQQVPCIFITHQLIIKAGMGWLEKIMQSVNYHFINRFTACWVPDAEGKDNLAGILSHPKKMPDIPVHYTGLLSRFSPKEELHTYDYCILLSGPEPQRTLLEEKILAGLPDITGKILLIRGKPGDSEEIKVPGNTEVYNHLSGEPLQKAIAGSNIIVCRGGYTSLMELLSLQKKMLLIPTPGQTEQEYLAACLSKENIVCSTTQHKFTCAEDFALAAAFPFRFIHYTVFNETAVAELIEKSVSGHRKGLS